MRIETIICGQSNVYLLHGNQGAVLIDTGTAKYKEKVLECCRGANVRLILLTHGHFDHCQNAAYLAKQLGSPVGIAKEDVPLLEEHHKRRVYGKGVWGRLYAWASNRNIRTNEIESITPDIILKDGMSLLEYGIDGKIIGLAGHTKGSVGVLLSSGEFFVGDAMQNILFPAAAWCYEEYEQAKRSAALIEGMNAEEIYYGHGRRTRGAK